MASKGTLICVKSQVSASQHIKEHYNMATLENYWIQKEMQQGDDPGI